MSRLGRPISLDTQDPNILERRKRDAERARLSYHRRKAANQSRTLVTPQQQNQQLHHQDQQQHQQEQLQDQQEQLQDQQEHQDHNYDYDYDSDYYHGITTPPPQPQQPHTHPNSSPP